MAVDVPQPDGPVLAGGGNALAVRVKRDAVHGLRADAEGRTDRFPVRDAPQSYGVVFAAAGERLAVRAECEGVDGAGVAGERAAQWTPRVRVPEPERAVGAGDHERAPVRARRDGPRCSGFGLSPAERTAAVSIPEPHGPVVSGGGEGAAGDERDAARPAAMSVE